MILGRFNPTGWVLVLLIVLAALMFILSANSYQPELGQVQGTPSPVTTIQPTVQPSVSSIISPTIVITTPVPPLPVPTAPIPVTISVPVVRTPTFAPATVTALVQAHLTAIVEQYGPSVPDPNPQAREAEAIAYRSLFTRPGTLIAEGTNTVPTGTLNLLTYRVEEVTLPGPTTFTRWTVGHTVTVDKAWRVTITGGPFPVDDSTIYHLLINHRMVARGTNRTLEMMFLVFDRALLQEGATLGVSPGGTLPERLHFLP